MFKLNAHALYGVAHDNEGLRGDNNFEFRFASPESIPNAVKRYNDQRAAELAQLRKDREPTKLGMPRFCKIRHTGQDVLSKVTSRDLDVETQLSLLSEAEEEEGGELVRLSGGAEGKTKTKRSRHKTKKTNASKERHLEPSERVEELHREVCDELKSMERSEVMKVSTKRKKKAKRGTHKSGGGGDAAEPKPISYEDYPQQQAKWVDIMPSAMMSQAIRVNVCKAPNASPQEAYEFMEQHNSLEPEPMSPFFQEDSDLEHEFRDRESYLRYLEPRTNFESSEQEMRLGPEPCFVELEQRPYRISLLRSLQPMQYTSQKSEDTGRTYTVDEEEALTKMSVEVKPKKPAKSLKNLKKTQKAKVSAPAPAPAPAPAQPPSPPQTRRRKPRPKLICSKSLEHLKDEKLIIYNKIALAQERIIAALDRLQSSLLQLQVPPCNSLEKQRRERNAFEFCVRFSRNFLYPLKGMIDDVRFTTEARYNSANSNEACQRVVCVYGLMLQSLQTYQRQLRYFLLDKVPQKLSALIEMIYTMTNICLDKAILDRQDPVVECLQQRCTKFLTFIEDMQEERFQLARESYRRVKKRKFPLPQPHQRYDLKMCLNELKFYEPKLVPKERKKPLLRLRKMKAPSTSAPPTAVPANPVTERPSDLQVPPHMDQLVNTQIEDVDYASSAVSLRDPALLALSQLAQQPEYRMDNYLHQALLEALKQVSKSQVQQVLDPIMRSLGAMLEKKLRLNLPKNNGNRD